MTSFLLIITCFYSCWNNTNKLNSGKDNPERFLFKSNERDRKMKANNKGKEGKRKRGEKKVKNRKNSK